MDSDPSVALSPTTKPTSASPPPRAPLSSHEGSSDESLFDDDYETASDPDDQDPYVAAARTPKAAVMPIAPVTRDDDAEVEEEVADGSPKGENLSLSLEEKGDGSEVRASPGSPEEGKGESFVGDGVRVSPESPEEGKVEELGGDGGGEAVRASLESPEEGKGEAEPVRDRGEEKGVWGDVEVEKEGKLGGGEDEEVPETVVDVAAKDLKGMDEVEGSAVVSAPVEKDENLGVVEGKGDVEVVDGVQENEVASAPEEKDGNFGAVVDSKAVEVETGDAGVVAGVEENVKPGEVESPSSSPVVLDKDGGNEMEADGELKPEQAVELDAAVVGKDVAAESAASDQKNEEGVDSKPLEEEANDAKVEEVGAADSINSDQKVVEVKSSAVEAEKSEVADDVNTNKSLEMASDTTPSESLEPSSTKLLAAVGGADKEEALIEGAISVDSAEKTEVENEDVSQIDDEKVVTDSESSSKDLEAKPIESEPEPAADGGEVIATRQSESLPIPAVESIKAETEGEASETSGVSENGVVHEIAIQRLPPISVSDQQEKPNADISGEVDDDDENMAAEEAEEEEDGASSDKTPRVAILDSSETAKQLIKEMEEGSSSASSHSAFSRDYSRHADGQIVTDSDEEGDDDDEGDGKELFDSAALAALLKAATGASSDGNITFTSQDGTRVFSVDRPAGLGSSAPSLRPAAPRSVRPTLFNSTELAVAGEAENMDEEEKKLHEKVEQIRVKFLRLVMRLGHSPEDSVAAQVLYRLSLAEGVKSGRQFGRGLHIESAKKRALQLEEGKEAGGKEDLNFACNILVIGKSGVGKSATINSIFGEEKSYTSAFERATSSVREISGVVDGVKIRVIDTPGLKSSVMDQGANRKILQSIQKYMKRCPPDIILYVDRLDTQTRDLNDLPLLRSITTVLGSSIWFNAIVALTHAASAPPDGPNGSPLSYEVFIAQRSHVVQHSIRQAVGDMRLMNPVALVENHPSCRRNREGERVLPNGLSWRPQMLLLCYSSKILSEANSLLQLQDPSPGKLFGLRLRSPPLPFLLSSLLQSRPHPKLSTAQGGDDGDSDIDLDDFSDTEMEEQDEYDQLPPFKPLRKSQIAKLTKEQKRAYFDEYDYRVRLLQKKQWKDELRRLKEMKKGKSTRDESPYGGMPEDYDDGAPPSIPVAMPDMVLPPSFDSDVPTYRYRFLEPSSQLLTRPVLDTHGWDHDCGYDGVSLEESLAIASRFPAAVSVQITKDKKEFNIHLDSSVSAKHGENGSTLAGFDIQSIGKQLAYILRGETKFKNLKKNKTTGGISVTFLGETVATGLKIEDQVSIGNRLSLVASTGAIRANKDVAYGANLEARLREKDYPIGQALSTLGLSLMKWHGDLALGANLQSQFSLGRNSKMAVRVGLNNKLSGQITVRTSTSEQLQLALVGILPVAVSVFRSIWPGESYMGH